MKLLAHAHSGQRVGHKHTSYASLAFLLLLTSFLTLSVSRSSVAVLGNSGDTQVNDSGGYAVYATVLPNHKPAAPHITAPAGGQFTTSPITVSGSCETSSMVKVFRNEVMAGAAMCANGAFSLPIDLFIGDNSVVARGYDALDEAGADSNTVKVSFAPPGASGAPVGAPYSAAPSPSQLVLTSDVAYKGSRPGVETSWTVTILGGTAPYALNVGWGDGKTDLVSSSTGGPVSFTHVYTRVGDGFGNTFNVSVSAADATGQHAHLAFVSIVSDGKPKTAVASSAGNQLLIVWPMLVAAVVLVLGFWLGEKREAWLIRRKQTEGVPM